MQHSQPARWEYLIVSCTYRNGQWWVSHVNNEQKNQQKSMVAYTQEAGKLGWELISTHMDPPIGHADRIIRLFFKRRQS